MSYVDVIWLSVGHALLAIVQCWPWVVVLLAAMAGPLLLEMVERMWRRL